MQRMYGAVMPANPIETAFAIADITELVLNAWYSAIRAIAGTMPDTGLKHAFIDKYAATLAA
ncbi:MAG: hypothetical protein O2880_10640, partial [Proteobacteria bacterium]|nr:hypothetical protein [Pseudomonadota bacterium]